MASTGHVFVQYYGVSGSYSTSVSISSGDIKELNMNMYGPFSTLSVTGGNALLKTYTSNDPSSLSINFRSLGD